MKSNDLEKLTAKQLHTLPYLVACASYEEAARQAGVSAKQIHAWLKIPLFEEELNQLRNAAFFEAMRSLKMATQKAVCTLVGCLDDENAKNRISAADKIIAHAFRGVELYEIEDRLGEVEARLTKALEKQGPQIKENL